MSKLIANYSGSLVAGENARRHFDIPRGIPEEFIPSKRLVSHCEHGPEMRNTRLAIHTNRYNKSGIYNPAEQRHFQNLLKLPPCSVKRPAKMQVDTVLNSSEYSLTDTMTRKKGVEKEKVRNLIPVANLGDKAYRDPSRSSGFFAQAGLIPGSTFCISKSRATLSKSSTDATSDAPIRKIASLSAIEKRNIEVLMSDRDQVAALTVRKPKRYWRYLFLCLSRHFYKPYVA